MTRAGYVLVGGRSSRMGRDKALLPFRGRPLVESVAREVQCAAGTVTLVGDPSRYAEIGYRIVPDLYPDEGPLGGILTALADTACEWNLVVACDMPAVSASLLGRLLDSAREHDADALVPFGPSGVPEPLCAVYHRRSRRSLETAFARGIRKVTAGFSGLRVAAFAVGELASFQNVNTPEDWAGYAAD